MPAHYALQDARSHQGEGAATLEDLEEFSAGLICLTGGDEGPLAAALAQEGQSEAHKLAEQLARSMAVAIFYIELQRHGLREEECRNQSLLSLASSLNLPVIATNGVRYATEKDREILDVLTTIRHHTSLDKAGRLLSQQYSRSLRLRARWQRCSRHSRGHRQHAHGERPS
jgi:error-prone DNA polymerase